jgi:hypothetical protein
VDEGLLILAAVHVAVVAVGLFLLCLARRRPRTAAVLIVVTLVAGFGLLWTGAYIAQDDYEVGRRLYQAGILGVLYGLPAAVPCAVARQRTGDTVGPVGVRGWVNGVGMYLFAWWATAFVVGCIAALGMAQSGSFR